MSFTDDLKAAKEQPRRTVVVPIELAGNKHVVRVTAMAGIDWAVATVRHPVRPGVNLDAQYGYNLHSLVAAETSMFEHVNGAEVEAVDPDEWRELLEVLDGAAVQDITDAVFALNEFASDKDVQDSKKALDVSLKYLASLPNLESIPVASTSGSRKSSPNTSTTKKTV